MTAAQARPAALVVINPSGNRNKVLISETPFQIGRQSDNHLTLRDNRISRAHARVIYDNGYFIEDLESRHGTFINGERVQRQLLRSSDRVEFGFADSYKLLFLFDDDEIGRLLQQIQTGQSLVTGGTNLESSAPWSRSRERCRILSPLTKFWRPLWMPPSPSPTPLAAT